MDERYAPWNGAIPQIRRDRRTVVLFLLCRIGIFGLLIEIHSHFLWRLLEPLARIFYTRKRRTGKKMKVQKDRIRSSDLLKATHSGF
ncbi:hypothetical protein CH371_06530 [Leptospira wolffii]|uniref:Uncharacterized protein n=1 Tax=Leptospira wolffii TaxID=409998 RepID=A0A2M9ZGX9_9LEPT|nr:hypothetical protein CH371_06530 [Leptospira wolffii]